MDKRGEETSLSGSRRFRRDFDLKRAVRQFVYPAIVLYFVVMLAVIGAIQGASHLVDVLIGTMAIGFIAGVMILGIAVRCLRKQSEAAELGYNVQDGSKPLFGFGTREYTRYRIDAGVSESEVTARSPYRDTLAYRQREQRGHDCRVCQTTIGRNGGYFVERRQISRVFGIPIREQIRKTEAYCMDHKPDEFQ